MKRYTEICYLWYPYMSTEKIYSNNKKKIQTILLSLFQHCT